MAGDIRPQHATGKTSPRLKASKTFIPLALFGLAFAGALFVLKRPGPSAAAPALAREVARPARVASSLGAASAEPAAAPTDPQQPDADASPAAASVAPPRAAPVPESLTASDGPPEVSASAQMPRVADDIAQAIDTLREGTPGDRVLAIQSLAATGHSGRSLSRIRQSLRFAASDQDPDVAARAQEAYDSLVKREDP